MSLFLRTLGYNELTCPIKEKHKLIRENVLSVHTGVTCPPKLSLRAPNTKGHTKQANWLLDWVDVPYEWNRVPQLLEVCQFLVSTAKHWGAAGATTVNLEENTIGTNDPSIPRSGPASHQQQGTCLAKPNNYWVQACSALLKTGQLTERKGVEARNRALFGKLTDREDGWLPQNNHFLGGLDARFFNRTEMA